MKNYLIKLVGAVMVVLFAASPAFAQSVNIPAAASAGAAVSGAGVNATLDAKLELRITKGKERANQEIDRRIAALNALNTRIQAMERLNATEKANLSASLTSQISALTTLKAKIAADSDIETLKADIKSIAGSYRIFLLVIPQGHITVTSYKLKSVADTETALAVKLSARIDAAAAAGKDVTALTTMLADMQAKTSDANVQADAALALVANLTPDEGDKTKATANNQALKDARAKIKAGLQDIVTARKDARTIVKALAEFHLEGSGSASTTTP